MYKTKNFKIITLVIVCLSVFAITAIVYATFTKQLSISGSTSVSPNEWNVKITSLTVPSSSSPYATINLPNVPSSGSTLESFTVSFSRPCRALVGVEIRNLGTINAHLSNLDFWGNDNYGYVPISGIECKVGNDYGHPDAIKVCNNISASMDFFGRRETLYPYDPSHGHYGITAYIRIDYNQGASDGSDLPSTPVEVYIPSINFEYASGDSEWVSNEI